MNIAIPYITCHEPLWGGDWIKFRRQMIGMTDGQRSSRPRVALDAILDAACCGAACRITDRLIAQRIGCKVDGAKYALSTLRHLGIIHCITDPRSSFGRVIILAQHPGAAAVLDELSQCQRVLDRNEEFELWFPREPETDLEYLETRWEFDPPPGPPMLRLVS